MDVLNNDMYQEFLKYVPQMQLSSLRLVSIKFDNNIKYFIENGLYIIKNKNDIEYAIDNNMTRSIMISINKDKIDYNDVLERAYLKRNKLIVKMIVNNGMYMDPDFFEGSCNIIFDFELLSYAFADIDNVYQAEPIIKEICNTKQSVAYFNFFYPKFRHSNREFKFDDMSIEDWLNHSYPNRIDIFKLAYEKLLGDYFKDIFILRKEPVEYGEYIGGIFWKFLYKCIRDGNTAFMDVLLNNKILKIEIDTREIMVIMMKYKTEHSEEINALLIDFFSIDQYEIDEYNKLSADERKSHESAI